MTCRVCGVDTVLWLDLGLVPLANQLLEPGEYPNGVRSYPLRVRRCPGCTLSQLETVVPPAELFSDYPYRSRVSAEWREHCTGIPQATGLYVKPRITLDVGANDGTLVKA